MDYALNIDKLEISIYCTKRQKKARTCFIQKYENSQSEQGNVASPATYLANAQLLTIMN
jgi:hypothetical protein